MANLPAFTDKVKANAAALTLKAAGKGAFMVYLGKARLGRVIQQDNKWINYASFAAFDTAMEAAINLYSKKRRELGTVRSL